MPRGLLNITLTGAAELAANLRALPPVVHDAILNAVQRQTIALQAHVVADKLSGQVLHVITGALRRSIQIDISDGGAVITGGVFSSGDVKYAGILEFGGQTAPHDIVPTKAKALHFMMGGAEVFATIVHHPGSKIPEFAYMRTSLEDRSQAIIDDIESSMIAAVRRVVEVGSTI